MQILCSYDWFYFIPTSVLGIIRYYSVVYGKYYFKLESWIKLLRKQWRHCIVCTSSNARKTNDGVTSTRTEHKESAGASLQFQRFGICEYDRTVVAHTPKFCKHWEAWLGSKVWYLRGFGQGKGYGALVLKLMVKVLTMSRTGRDRSRRNLAKRDSRKY